MNKVVFTAFFMMAAVAVVAATPAEKRTLHDDMRITAVQAAGADYFAEIPHDEDLEFKLECTLTRRWQVKVDKPGMVRISSELDRKAGKWWQEFEIDGSRRGECVLTFSHPDGKVMRLHLKIY